MFFFLRLLLAHLLGDFLFQTNGIFKLKVKYNWGVLLHGSIVGLVAGIFSLPYLQHPIVVSFLVISWVFHIFQDKAKIIINLQVERNNLWTFLSDQLLHIGVYALIAFSTVPGVFPVFTEVLDPIYKSDKIIIFAIWILVLTYCMFVLQEYIKKIVKGDKKEGVAFPGLGLKYYGIATRTVIGVSIWAGGSIDPLWYVLSAGGAALGFYMVKIGRVKKLDYQISTIAAVVIGFLMQLTVK
ncbi:MAG: DUF3307 domain-containing protein [Candidatus Firestonebacteria bacterium]